MFGLLLFQSRKRLCRGITDRKRAGPKCTRDQVLLFFFAGLLVCLEPLRCVFQQRLITQRLEAPCGCLEEERHTDENSVTRTHRLGHEAAAAAVTAQSECTPPSEPGVVLKLPAAQQCVKSEEADALLIICRVVV